MHELRLVAVSEDGTYLVLASTGRGTRFMLPVDDRLRAAVRGQFSRLGQYEIEVENPLRPKEIQARIRSGETAEAISEISGIPIERVRWFEGPVLQEREYIAQQAQRATVRASGDATPGPSLEEVVTKRIGAHQLETGDASWDSWRREDRTWQIKLVFLHGGDERVAHWLYEPRHNSVTPADEEAARFSESPSAVPLAPPDATVTPFSPRRPEGAVERPRPAPEPPSELRTDPAPPARRLSSAPDTLPDEPLRAADRTRPDPFDPPVRDERHQRPQNPLPPREAPRADPAANHRAPERRDRLVPDHLTGRAAPAHTSGPAPAAEPDSAPPPAEPPAQPRPARRRRATIDLSDAGPTRRAAPEPPSAPAAAGGAGGAGDHTASKRKGRGRRASVPSWDEIMFGSKKGD
ncbi:septation protein SepH [Nocardiopsis sp. EMB25]|uniref:septation protein SepH n=2 Tax=Nocardiopsis TaxID=2013 RepID=UPI0022837C08|nr:septation protein SepH [Nocardiopsis sp. EMB25]MCY9784510.1 septation protein SepH [Nocardiopsis sp. EMB25]